MRKANSLFIFLIVIFLNINYLSADQSIVSNDSAKSLIPKGIEFSIDLLTKENIEDIQVKFKVQGRKSFQYEYLDLDDFSVYYVAVLMHFPFYIQHPPGDY